MLLLHGFTGCASVWDEVIAHLDQSFDILCVDLPGHGGTTVPDNHEFFRMESVARSLLAILDSLRIPRVHVWGYSMGGRLALHGAVHFPQRIASLILESASPGIADEGERVERHNQDDLLAARIEQFGLEQFVEEWSRRPLFASQRTLRREKQDRARQLRLQNSATGLALSLRGMGTGVQEPLHEKLKALRAPTLVLTGALDRKFGAIGAQMAGDIPAATHRVIADCGHAPHWESPRECARVVSEFLADSRRESDPPATDHLK